MNSRLASLEVEYAIFRATIKSIVRKQYSTGERVELIADELNKMSESAERLKECVEHELFDAMGPPGKSGDALKILALVNNIYGCVMVFMNRERDIYAAVPPTQFRRLAKSFRGTTQEVIRFANELRNDWSNNVEAMKEGFNSV